MNGRKITSLTMLVALALCTATSLILYTAPYGRVAYWSDWHFWGLSKTEWSNLHLNLGFLFLLTGFIHLYHNWHPLKRYLGNRTRQLQFISLDFAVALLLCAGVGFGTYLEIPPMASLLDLGITIKDAASIRYGEPPYGHAELSSLRIFADRTGLDPKEAMNLLRQQKLVIVGEADTIQDIARRNSMAPKAIYRVIAPASTARSTDGRPPFPDSPPPGFGTRNPATLGEEYGLDVNALLADLQNQGVQADPEQSIRNIAATNDLEPMAVFEMIRNFAVPSQPE